MNLKIEKYLNNEIGISSSNLKKLLFNCKLKDKTCEKCKLTEWCNEPITLHLHHINGNNKDNQINNLLILCPNCHSQTDNYSGKNKPKKKSKEKVPDEIIIEAIKSSYTKRQALLKCGLTGYGASYKRINLIIEKYNLSFLKRPFTEKEKGAIAKRIATINEKYESSILAWQNKIDWPDKDTLENLLKENSCSKLSKILGVSDNAIRNKAKNYGINVKEISPWAKRHGKKE